MLNIALPSSGPLYQSTIDFFNNAGIPIKRSSLRAYSGTTNFDKNIKIIFQRQSDITNSISNKVADIGVLGLDRYLENIQSNKTKILIEKLGYGNCDLVIAVPQSWNDINNVSDLVAYSNTNKLKIATKYPIQTQNYLSANYMKLYEIISTKGAVESAPQTGIADIIVDISSTGTTIRENNLKILDDGYILFSEATLISNPVTLSNYKDKFNSAKKLLQFILGYINSQIYNTIIFNIAAPDENELFRRLNNYKTIKGIIGPTISKVYSNDELNWYAVTIVVSNDDLNDAIEVLNEILAEGITVIQNKLVFDKALDLNNLLKE